MNSPAPWLIFCGIAQFLIWPRESEAVEYVTVPEGTVVIYIAEGAHDEAPEDRPEAPPKPLVCSE